MNRDHHQLALAALARSITSRGGGWCYELDDDASPTDDAVQVAALRPSSAREARRAHLRAEMVSAQQARDGLVRAMGRAQATGTRECYGRRIKQLEARLREFAEQIGAL